MTSAVLPPEPAASSNKVILAELPPLPPSAARRTSCLVMHGTLLGLALVVVVLACAMHTQETDRVYLPLLGVPLPPLCMFRFFTGANCPGCGLTRAFIHIAHGDLAGAWRFNPAAFLWFPIIAAQLPYRTWQISRVRRGLPEFFDYRLLWCLWLALGALFLQWGVRLVDGALP